MVVLNTGLNTLRNLLSTDLTQGDWGTGTTQELPGDTELETEISGIEVSTTNITKDKTVNVTSVLPSTSANGNTVSEHVVRHSTGEVWSRTTFTGISKTSDKEIHTINTFVLNQG